jgi:hypothetical protein
MTPIPCDASKPGKTGREIAKIATVSEEPNEDARTSMLSSGSIQRSAAASVQHFDQRVGECRNEEFHPQISADFY